MLLVDCQILSRYSYLAEMDIECQNSEFFFINRAPVPYSTLVEDEHWARSPNSDYISMPVFV